jgi:nucleoside-diphosphate-sugar epimerase
VLNPVYVFGPTIQHAKNESEIKSTVGLIYPYISGATQVVTPQQPFQNFVDVRDVALAHLRAATEPKASGKRIILSAGGFSALAIVNIIRKHFPDLTKVPQGDGSSEPPKTEADNSLAKQILGLKFIGLEESVVDTVECVKHLVA